MAITKIAGELLESNLIRQQDLAFNSNLLYVDVSNGRIGVGTDSPGNFALDVNGDARVVGNLTVQGTTTTVDSQNLTVEDNLILLNSTGSIGHNSGVMINRGSAGNNAVMIWDESADLFKFGTTTDDGSTTEDFSVTLSKIQAADPTTAQDVATKSYVDTQNTAQALTFVGDDSTGTVVNTGESFKFAGATGITTAVSGDTLTITGPNLTNYLQNTGTQTIDNLIFNDNILATSSNADLVLSPGGSGDIDASTSKIINLSTPTADTHASTKKYVDDSIGSLSSVSVGTQITLGTPDDSTFGDGSYTSLSTATKVTDAIDSLNETMENIRNSTYVKSVTFTSNATNISLDDTVTLSISTVGGGANRYTITWGDGATTTGTTDATPSHTYDDATNTPMTVTVKAFANGAGTTDSSGSFAEFTRSNYINVATAAPVVNFAIYAGSSGGSVITKADNGSTVYLQNNTTNTAGANTFDVDWGDGTENTIANNTAAGGQGGARLAHTYNNASGDDGSTVAGSGAGDTKYAIKLRLLTHPSADASTFPQTRTNNFEVYSAHTVAYSTSDSTIRGINEESTSGFPVTFTNNTNTVPGANSAFSETQQYTYNFGEGDSNTVVAVGSGGAGDTGGTINNTFNLTSSNQTNGVTSTFTTSLTLANGHTGSTFSKNMNIIVEPDVRANIAATADKVSTASGDNQYSLYDHTDLAGANRASATFTNTSQNANNYDYDFFSDSSSLVTMAEDGSTAGSTGTNLTRNFTGTSAGNFVTRFRAYGTPDTFFQDDEETISWAMKAVPSAPANLSAKSLEMSDNAQGTSPKLCHGFTDNTSSADTLSPGVGLNTVLRRRYTSTSTIDTATVTNAYNGSSGTLTASLNASANGAKTFSASAGENGTFTSLIVTNNRDYDEVNSAYPQDFYQVFTAKITKALSAYSTGLTAQRLEHSATGNTNYVWVLKDDITAVPTTAIGTVAEGTAGTKQYVSGIAYYDAGSPTVTVTGTTIANFTGQAYQDTTSPHEVDNDTNQESTSGDVITNSNFTYANVDGSTTMLSSSIPKSDIGVGGAYTIGAVTVPITGSGVKSVKTIKARSKNANGTGSYNSSSTKIQVYTASVSGLDNEAGGITVSDSLGNGSTHTDDALRITGFGSSSDTPSFNSSTNYYTGNAWSGAVTVAETTEAISRFGTIKHFTTNLSSGYLPAGPNLTSGRDGGEAQYYTFAFRRTPVSQFSITMSGKVSGMFIAMPGTGVDSSSGSNGWLDCSTQYNGSGQPGSGGGGNGSDGCAKTGGDRVVDNTTYSGKTFTFTLGTESLANSVGNTCLVRIKLNSGDSVTALSVGVAG